MTRVALLAGLAIVAGSSAPTAQPVRDSTRVVRVVDEAIRLLGDPSADYRKILGAAVTALPVDAESAVRADISRVLTRLPEAGPDFRCNAEFVRARARKALRRIRDQLLNAPADRVEPAVCYAAPFAIDSTRREAADGRVHIYGYDLDVAPLEIVVVTRDGHRDVTAASVVLSHYHLELDLAAVTSIPDAVSVGVAWAHLIRYSIPLIRPETRLCSTRIETVRAGKTIFAPSNGTLAAGGATGAGARVWADASLDYENNEIDATICITADRGGGGPLFSGCTVGFVYTTHADWIIDGVFGAMHADVSYAGSAPRSVDRSGGGPVRRWVFSGPGPGDSKTAFPSVTAELTAIRVVSTAADGCLSPQAYLEARRTSVVSDATRLVLDPQLQRVDRAILSLRPRFAPEIPKPAPSRQ